MKRTITARPTQPHITPITMAVTSPAGIITETNRKVIKSEQKYGNKASQRIKKVILQKVIANICIKLLLVLPEESSFPDSTKYRINNHFVIFRLTRSNQSVYLNSICCSARSVMTLCPLSLAAFSKSADITGLPVQPLITMSILHKFFLLCFRLPLCLSLSLLSLSLFPLPFSLVITMETVFSF